MQALGVGHDAVGRGEVDAQVQRDVEAALEVVQEVEALFCRHSMLTLGAVVHLQPRFLQGLTFLVEQNHLVSAESAQLLV